MGWTNSCIAALVAAGLSLPAVGQFGRGPRGPQKTTTPPPLQFHYMGPPPGGRIASASGVPGDDAVVYLGSASGGLWKSTDGGHTFQPIFDEQDAAAIGTITVAPANHNVVWVGTGEPWVIRPSDIIGDGVYKSTDAGATWQHMGLVKTGRIAAIVINPKDTDNVFVCAEGRLSSPQQHRGVYRSTDGGQTWTRTLFVNPHTGCSGLSMDPMDPNTLFAGTWQVKQRTWVEASGGPGSGVYVSHDNGVTWTHLTGHGLPHSPLGKIDVAIAPSNPQRVYALIQTGDQGSLWRSDDGGQNWTDVSWDRTLIGRAGYYIHIEVDPTNDNNVLITSSNVHYSTNGGRTFSGEGGPGVQPIGPASCGDCHDSWMDPTNPKHYILTDDGGASIATGAGTALHVSLPNGQTYHVFSDNRVPYWLYTNRQDNGTWRGPSDLSADTGNGMIPKSEFMPVSSFNRFAFFFRRRRGKVDQALLAQYPKEAPTPAGWAYSAQGATKPAGGFGFGGPPPTPAHWQYDLGGCESGFTVPDPTNANIVWASCYGNKLTRYNAVEGTAHSVAPSEIALDSSPTVVKYRCHWTSPVAIDPFNHDNVYYGCQLVLRTSNAGQRWMEFSPNLSTQNPARIVNNGGIMGDNLAQYDGEVVWSLAFSPIVKGLLWAGTNDGKLWYTRGAEDQDMPHWTDVTANLHLPPWGEINQIAPSPSDPGTVYIAVDFRMAGQNNYKPYILKTTDFGKTWTNIDGDIPSTSPLDYILSVAVNPNRKGMLFAGSAHAFYYSLDDGGHWINYMHGLPPSPVDWIHIEPRMHDIDISTYGRGLFVMPDITTFEQTGSPAVPSGDAVRLFKPGLIFRKARSIYPTAAEPARPQFQFYLPTAPTALVTLEILDRQGHEIRTMKMQAHQGLNGAYWNLLYNPPTLVRLLTTPPENPHIWAEPRYQGKTYRTIIHWGITPTTGIPMAAPGDYEVRLIVDGQNYTQPFHLAKSPEVQASDAALRESTALQVQLSRDLTETSLMVNQMEKWRKQIEAQLRADSPDTGAALRKLNGQILDVEHQLVSEESMLSDDKYFPTAYRVYMNLVWLSGQVGQGAEDVGGGVDYQPTVAQRRVTAKIEAQLAHARMGFNQLKSTVLPEFNTAMAGKGAHIVIAAAP